MARIFTTSFTFNHQNYDAIVTVCSKNGKVNFTIQVMDMDLQQLLPKGGVKYEGLNGYENVESLNDSLSRSLLRSISKAIESHMSV